MTPVRILCLAIQSWTLSRREAATMVTGGLGGGLGLTELGIHGFDERVSRT